MRILITGSEGFVGNYLKSELSKRGDKIFSFDIKKKQDITNYENIRNYLDKVRPDEIYHLAAQAFVPESFANPQRTMDINVKGTINLLEAVRQLGIRPKILLACSSEEYGDVDPYDCPIREDQPLRPQSPYAISKVAVDMLGEWYADYYGLHIVRTRAFNHTGPGRGEMYVTSSFAKQIMEDSIVSHGNLDAVRDITDVRDMVRAYALAISLQPDVYNIGSGHGYKIEELLDMMIKLSGKKVKKVLDKSRCRKTDVPVLICDNTKFSKLTGWKPEYIIDETLKDLLAYWSKK